MKASSKLTALLSALLLMSMVAGVPLASATSVVAEPATTGVVVREVAEQLVVTENIEALGPAGSGWKPDVWVGGSPAAWDEVNPSMATYIDPVTGAVTLWVAMQAWMAYTYSHWVLWIWRSDDRGATWWQRGAASWISNRSIINPSIAVSPYNGTVFVAVQNTAFGAFTNDISIHRISPEAGGPWSSFDIDADADDDRDPQLVSEYAFKQSNYLFVSYEKYTSSDDRDLYVGRSTNWGKTWSTKLLRGGDLDSDVYTQSSIAYVQGNLYVAYRHSTDYGTTGHIDVSNSSDLFYTWSTQTDVSHVPNDASWPSITGAHVGEWFKPVNVMVAYQYAATTTNDDILFAAWTLVEDKWNGGNDYWHQVAVTSANEKRPALTIDGMGTEKTSVEGNYHLAYWTSVSTATRTNGLCYTQLPYWDVPLYWGGPYSYTGSALGWSTPHGMIVDDNAHVSARYPKPTITPFTRTVGGYSLWMPGVAWTDYRSASYAGDIYFTTPGTDFSITFFPSSQSVVAGKSISYYVTVNLLAGTTAPAYMGVANWIAGASWVGAWWTASYSTSPITPTATTTLTITTSNLHPLGSFSLNATATIGGYRRIFAVPYTVTAPPTLTLDLSPTTVARGALLTISGDLNPDPGAPTTIYLFYRSPHEIGSWRLATTLITNPAGTFSVTVTVPWSAPVGQVDLVAFWVNLANGAYATSPIKLLTIT